MHLNLTAQQKYRLESSVIPGISKCTKSFPDKHENNKRAFYLEANNFWTKIRFAAIVVAQQM